MIGSFSAASNVTGLVADVDGITEELHRAGALAFWDYAAAAPYLNIDMNPVRFFPDGALNPYVYKDAVFISPHKFPGGPGAPGVLVAKRSLFMNDVPCEPGGGTVFFVTDSDQRYLSSRQEREEGGTQDIIGSIRAGLAFQVKQSVGESAIREAEATIVKQMYDSLMQNPNIAVLGPPDVKTFETVSSARLPVISFLVRGPADEKGRSRFLHHSFVCAVLNDVFGGPSAWWLCVRRSLCSAASWPRRRSCCSAGSDVIGSGRSHATRFRETQLALLLFQSRD